MQKCLSSTRPLSALSAWRASARDPGGLYVLLLLVVICAWPASGWPQTTGTASSPEVGTVRERKVALVVGNSAYETSALKNPVNDARAVAKALRELDFEVLLRENVTSEGFTEALRTFGSRLKPGSVSLFYFAGHGMQVGGRNYLIPVGASIENEDEVPYRAIDANQVLDKMGRANSSLNLVILDACRNNPFTRSFRAQINGLAHMEAPSGTLIAFATSPGSVAADGDGTNSTYTKHLLANIATPGVPVEIALKRVREGVSRETLGKQIPWESSSIMGDFYFRSGEAGTKVAIADTPETRFSAEKAFWESIQDKGGTEEYLAYLRQYPNGRFASLAKARLDAVQVKQQAPPPSSATGGNDAFELAYWDSIKSSTSAADYKAYLEQYPRGRFAGLASNRLQGLETKVAATRSTTLDTSKPGLLLNLPRIGDSWTYNLMEGGKRPVNTVTMTVTGLDGENIQEKITHDNLRGPGAVRAFRPGFNPGAGIQEMALSDKHILAEFSPYIEAAGLPALSSEWKDFESTLIPKDAGASAARLNMSIRAVGKDYVKLPAGEFATVRVEIRAKPSEAKPGDATDYLLLTYWYSPEVRRAVKISLRQPGKSKGTSSTDTLELSGFHQSR